MPKKILIVEDDDGIRSALSGAFALEGYDVRVAKDGLNGLSTLLAFTPDVIFVDLRMPKLDGAQFVERLPKDRSYAVYVMSAGEKFESISDAQFISKPMQLADLFALIEK